MNYIKVWKSALHPPPFFFSIFLFMPFLSLHLSVRNVQMDLGRGTAMWAIGLVNQNSKDHIKYCLPGSVELTYKLSLHNFVTWAIKISIEKWIGQRMRMSSFCCDFKTTIVFPFPLFPQKQKWNYIILPRFIYQIFYNSAVDLRAQAVQEQLISLYFQLFLLLFYFIEIQPFTILDSSYVSSL